MLARGGIAATRALNQAAQDKNKASDAAKSNEPSQTFGSGVDFARFAMEKALTKDDTAERQLDEAKKSTARLDELVGLAKRPAQRGGLILRGRTR